MTAKQIKDFVKSGVTLFEFTYNGKDGNIDPYYSRETRSDRYLLYYDGFEQEVDSIEEVMTTPFINGQSLNKIADQLTVPDIYNI